MQQQVANEVKHAFNKGALCHMHATLKLVEVGFNAAQVQVILFGN